MKLKLFSALFLICLGFMTLSLSKKSNALKLHTGTYGVGCCEDQNEDASSVRLKLNDDHTFQYTDQSNSKKMINLTGTWVQKNNSVMLENYTSDFAIHNKWKIDASQHCLKSRLGLEFMRLCLQAKP